jgi:hypothetical protein
MAAKGGNMNIKIINIELVHQNEYDLSDIREIVAVDFFETDDIPRARLIRRMG